jgi:hypothetical protein
LVRQSRRPRDLLHKVPSPLVWQKRFDLARRHFFKSNQTPPTRAARFFVTQTGENIPNYHNITKWPLNINQMAIKNKPNGHKIFQMTIK